MKIMNRKDFLAMPENVVYSTYYPHRCVQACAFGELRIKGRSTGKDFFFQKIANAVKCSDADELFKRLEVGEETGASIPMDLDCQECDGTFDDKQLFAVWEREDVVKLIARLARCEKRVRASDTYVPIVLGESSGIMQVEVGRCCECGKRMISRRNPFPAYMYNSFDAQVEAAGWAIDSGAESDKGAVCAECVSAGKLTFGCALCGKQCPTDQIEDSFGCPAEYLCKPCYDTVPAKTWDAKREALEQEHRYDLE